MCCKKLLELHLKNIYLYSTYSSFLVINVCNKGETLCSHCISYLYMFRAHVLIIRGSKLYYTENEDSLNLRTGRPPIGVMIPETV